MSEMAQRSSLPAVPSTQSFGDLLGRYMWVQEVAMDWGWMNGVLTIRGNLKPDPDAASPSALRRSFLDSLDAVMAIMEAAGAKWESHPEVEIVGSAIHKLGGGQEFAGIECRCKLEIFG
jgi:hypothetical protein